MFIQVNSLRVCKPNSCLDNVLGVLLNFHTVSRIQHGICAEFDPILVLRVRDLTRYRLGKVDRRWSRLRCEVLGETRYAADRPRRWAGRHPRRFVVCP